MEAAMLARRSVFIALLAFVAIAVRRGAGMNPSASASPGRTGACAAPSPPAGMHGIETLAKVQIKAI